VINPLSELALRRFFARPIGQTPAGLKSRLFVALKTPFLKADFVGTDLCAGSAPMWHDLYSMTTEGQKLNTLLIR
jgi:hypothetical protein